MFVPGWPVDALPGGRFDRLHEEEPARFVQRRLEVFRPIRPQVADRHLPTDLDPFAADVWFFDKLCFALHQDLALRSGFVHVEVAAWIVFQVACPGRALTWNDVIPA